MSKPIFSTLPTGDFVLASASATRVKLLENAGIGFCQYPVSIDEGALRAASVAEAIPAQDIAVMLAEMFNRFYDTNFELAIGNIEEYLNSK